jgi:hypothetical protein
MAPIPGAALAARSADGRSDTLQPLQPPSLNAPSAIVAGCWKKVLAWPLRTLMTYHDPPMRAITADAHDALEKAARDAKQT